MSLLPSATSESSIAERFLEEFKALKREHEEFKERSRNMELNYERELLKEKDACKRHIQECNRLGKGIKDLRLQLDSQHQKLQLKEQEIASFKARLESKQALDERTKERDMNVFTKHLGRKPVSGNSQDSKLLTIVNSYEDQKTKLEKRVTELQKENSELKEINITHERKQMELKDSTESISIRQDKIATELMNKIAQLEFDKAENKRKLEFLEGEFRCKQENFSGLFKEHQELRKAHDRLKSESVKHQVRELNENIASSAGFKISAGKKVNDENENPNVKKKMSSSHSGKKFDQMNSYIVDELCNIFSLRNPEMILDCVRKTEQVMQAVPALENIINQVCKIVFSANGGEEITLENLVPTLKRFASEVKLVRNVLKFKDSIASVLSLDPLKAEYIDILEAIKILKDSQSENITHSKSDFSDRDQKLLDEVKRILEVDNDEDFRKRMGVITFQLRDINQFLNISKKVLNLDTEMKSEACLSYLLRFLETKKREEKMLDISSAEGDTNR